MTSNQIDDIKKNNKVLLQKIINNSMKSHNTKILPKEGIYDKLIRLSEILRLISEYKKHNPEKEIPTLFHIIVCRSFNDGESTPRSRGNKLIRRQSFSLEYIITKFNFCKKLEIKMNMLISNNDEEYKKFRKKYIKRNIEGKDKYIYLYKYILQICKLNIKRLNKNYSIRMRNFNFLNTILETPINEIEQSITPYLDMRNEVELDLFETNSKLRKYKINKMKKILTKYGANGV